MVIMVSVFDIFYIFVVVKLVVGMVKVRSNWIFILWLLMIKKCLINVMIKLNIILLMVFIKNSLVILVKVVLVL